MGKVKEWKEKYPDRVTEYQFPMGKVKGSDIVNILSMILVSIPYGKGKVQRTRTPYAYRQSINSLWER